MGATPDYEPFCPPIQKLGRKYRVMKATTVAVLSLGSLWVFEGRAFVRRSLFPPATVAESARVGGGFVAVSFPRLTEDAKRLTMGAEDFQRLLAGLRREGWVSVGLRDVEDFYRNGRPLPPKAVLLAFERDDAATMEHADRALREERMRAVVFINKVKPAKGAREALSPHAVKQMRKSGAWEIGWTAEHEPRWRRGDPVRPAVLDLGETEHSWTRNPFRYPVRFIVSRSGYNDASRVPWALRILRPRTDKTPEQVLAALAASLPRTSPFSDDFSVVGLGTDWVGERGVTVAVGGRLVVVPTPKQTAAAAYITGTDAWADGVVEFELRKYRRNAWVYVRASEKEDRWLRLGVKDGRWHLQQKTGAGKKPVTLAQAAMTSVTVPPARARLVVKGSWAIVHVNGRMQFGKALRVHPGIDRGRVSVDVYDPKPAAALAVFGSFAAAPLQPRWLGVSRDALGGDAAAEAALLDDVRERAVFASVITPRWLEVLADGRVAPVDEDFELSRSLAGYYRCALVPMLDFAAPLARFPSDRAGADRMLESIMAALRGSEATGLNIRLSPGRAAGTEAAYLLSRLRTRLHEEKRRLYFTVDGPTRQEPWLKHADALLRAVERPVPGSFVLKEANS